ncbi:MAG: AzlD domain-containing protein [Oscillospiraceae bacterium]|nr:AzlD domain-containing protein [Oscillospiraceae bacterium]
MQISVSADFRRFCCNSVCSIGLCSGSTGISERGGIGLSTAVYILVMAGVTYLIRVIPFGFFRKKITSKFLRSFLYYIPYAVLSAMTIPAIFYSTDSIVTAAAGTLTALVLAFLEQPLIIVALAASAAAFLTGLFL